MGQASEENYFFWDGDTLVVNILGRPSATKDAIGKPKGNQLKVSVTASPQQGRATDHMLRFLAPLFGGTRKGHCAGIRTRKCAQTNTHQASAEMARCIR